MWLFRIMFLNCYHLANFNQGSRFAARNFRIWNQLKTISERLLWLIRNNESIQCGNKSHFYCHTKISKLKGWKNPLNGKLKKMPFNVHVNNRNCTLSAILQKLPSEEPWDLQHWALANEWFMIYIQFNFLLIQDIRAHCQFLYYYYRNRWIRYVFCSVLGLLAIFMTFL